MNDDVVREHASDDVSHCNTVPDQLLEVVGADVEVGSMIRSAYCIIGF